MKEEKEDKVKENAIMKKEIEEIKKNYSKEIEEMKKNSSKEIEELKKKYSKEIEVLKKLNENLKSEIKIY
jgi:hypothetical protein